MRGDRLRDIRKSRQLTQEELAKLVGVSGQQIYRYESGENIPNSDVLTRLAQELSVSTDYLLGLVNEPTAHLTEEELSPMERRLLQAVRNGSIRELFKTLAALSDNDDQPPVTPDKPAVDG